MSSKFRTAYDRIYTGVETWLLARGAVKDGKKYAATVDARPELASEYKSTIVPYWKQFRVKTPKQFWFRLFANQYRPMDARYIPDDLWFHRIVPHYNNVIFAKALQDKCLHSVLFPDAKRPVTVVKRIAGVFYTDDLTLLSEGEAVAAVHGHGRVIVKPSVGSGQGHSIRFYDSDTISDKEIKDIFDLYGQNFVMQEKLIEHPDLARLNPSSLNTVRVVTFLHNDEVHILNAIVRVGSDGSEVDNTSQGGYKATILPDGHLMERGTTNRHGRWEYVESYPNGICFRDVVIPSYDRVKAFACDHARKMSHFKIIGWDIAVDTAGEPVLIEYNVIPSQGHGTAGPTFGDLTDDVLTEVFGRR